jgi:hypothetical protein
MVTGLLTLFLKVNPEAPNHSGEGVANMAKKTQGKWSFMDWLVGGGWSQAGNAG